MRERERERERETEREKEDLELDGGEDVGCFDGHVDEGEVSHPTTTPLEPTSRTRRVRSPWSCSIHSPGCFQIGGRRTLN